VEVERWDALCYRHASKAGTYVLGSPLAEIAQRYFAEGKHVYDLGNVVRICSVTVPIFNNTLAARGFPVRIYVKSITLWHSCPGVAADLIKAGSCLQSAAPGATWGRSRWC
jgi:hypothetical protein